MVIYNLFKSTNCLVENPLHDNTTSLFIYFLVVPFFDLEIVFLVVVFLAEVFLVDFFSVVFFSSFSSDFFVDDFANLPFFNLGLLQSILQFLRMSNLLLPQLSEFLHSFFRLLYMDPSGHLIPGFQDLAQMFL